MRTKSIQEIIDGIDLQTISRVTQEDLAETSGEIDWIFPRIIPASGVGVLGGFQSTGKTTILTMLAISVASGTPFFGHRINDAPGNVVFIGFESSLRSYKRKIQQILTHYKAIGQEVDEEVLWQHLLLFGESSGDLDEMEAEAMGGKFPGVARQVLSDLHRVTSVVDDIRLLVIDPLSGMGLTDEIAPAASFALWRALRSYEWAHDGLFLISHHLIKPAPHEPLLARLDIHKIRGGVHMSATPRIALMLCRLTETEIDRAGVPPLNEGEAYAVLGLEKFNDGPQHIRILLHMDAEGMWCIQPDGESAIETLVSSPRKKPATKVIKKLAVLARLHAGQTTGALLDLNKLAEELFVDTEEPRRSLRSALRHLADDGLIHREPPYLLTPEGIRAARKPTGRSR